MYRPEVRQRALALIDSGHSLRSISMSTGINRSALREWRDDPEKAHRSRALCPRCADRAKGVWKLRIMCADAWPGLVVECAQAMRAIRPENKVMMIQCQGCTEVLSCSRHWPCLIPQHGLGKKHLRKIELAEWQQVIVERYPGQFARGLLHPDGYRGLNRIRHALETGERWYEYPRYLFVNESADILGLCGETLDQLGVEWRFSKPNTISVAKRDAVARLDEFVGPKY